MKTTRNFQALLLGLLAAFMVVAPIPARAATITALQASVTKTSTFDGASLDVSALSGDFTVKLHISALSAASGTPTARFCLEDVAASDFTTPNYAWCTQVQGTLASSYDRVYSIRSADLPDSVALSFGKSTGKFRMSLVRLGGTTPTVTYDASLEQ